MNLLSLIIERLNQKANTTNLFQALYGLSTLNKEKGWSHYIGAGQAELVTGYDGNDGTVFWAKRGNVSINKTDQFATVSCTPMYITVFPLTAYLIVRKSSLPCDSSEAADYVANIFHKAVSGYDKDFKAAIKVAQYEVIPTAYNDSVPSLPLSYEWVTLTVDFNIQIVSTSEGCFEDCDNITFIDTQIYVNGELFTTVPYGSTEDIIVEYVTAGIVPTTFADGKVIVPDPEGGGAGNAVLNDEDGNFISTTVIPADSNTPVVAPNGEVFANGDLVDEVLSNGSIDIVVRYQTQGAVSTTVLANEIVVPDVPACEDATAVLKNTAGTTISSTDIASGASSDVIAPDATAVLKDTAGNIITTNPIPSAVSEDMVAPDASAVLRNSALTTISTTAIRSNASEFILAPDATAVLKDSAGTIITTNPIPSNVSEDMLAPDGSITVNSTAFDVVKSNGSFNVPVRYVNGTLVGSKVGANWEIPDPVVDPKTLITSVTFGSGVTLSYLITIDADTAGTYTSAAFSGGMASATYQKNGVGATLPITVVATDTLRITPNASGVIKLTGTYP